VRPTLHLTAAVTRHAGQFLARCLEVDGLAAHGASVQEAIQALTKLAARELADLQPPIPRPRSSSPSTSTARPSSGTSRT
jgi:predicted RNase H-like HicB family nuclease